MRTRDARWHKHAKNQPTDGHTCCPELDDVIELEADDCNTKPLLIILLLAVKIWERLNERVLFKGQPSHGNTLFGYLKCHPLSQISKWDISIQPVLLRQRWAGSLEGQGDLIRRYVP